MRTKYNNELRIENVGEKVTLVGWCSKKRNLGGLVFAFTFNNMTSCF